MRKLLMLVVPMFSMSLVLASVLIFGLRFDLGASPGWQVGLYYLMLVPLLVTPFLLAMQLSFPRVGRWEFFMLGLVALALAGAIVFGWFWYGPYTGFRDDRAMGLMSAFILFSGVALLSGYMVRLFVGVTGLFIQSRSTVIQ